MKFSQDFEKRNSATAQIWAVAGPAGFEIGPQRRDQFWKAGSDPLQTLRPLNWPPDSRHSSANANATRVTASEKFQLQLGHHLMATRALQTTTFMRQDLHQFPTLNHAKFFGRIPKLVINQRVTYEGTNAPPPIAW
jgi:hypothetical protein